MYKKFFPEGVSYKYIGSTEDYLSRLIERYVINKPTMDEHVVVFEVNHKYNLEHIKLPGRILETTYCNWASNYGGIECDPDKEINYDLYPTCDGTRENCRRRHGNAKRLGAFPSIPSGVIYL